ncbi:MAG: chorismate pyruvate-lyase family protein [Pseudomonadales bacterium]
MSVHPPLSFIQSVEQWQTWPSFEEQHANSDVGALAYPGLFTEYLRALSRGPVSVELIRQGPCTGNNNSTTVRRDVVIRVGNCTAAIASTLVEQAVIDRYPWLANLGSKPIGETLESSVSAVRSGVLYQAVQGNSPWHTNFASDVQILWARRYRYTFDGGELCIAELISDSIVSAIGRL